MTPPEPLRPPDLQALLDELVAGRGAAHGPLADLHARVRALAHQHLLAHEPLRALLDSEDLTQETLLSLLHEAPRFRGTSWREFLAFVAAVLKQRMAHAGRRARAGNRDLRRTEPLGPEHLALPGEPALVARVAHREEHRDLLARIAALPSAQREALQLRLSGHDHAAIAAALGITAAAARQRVSRALHSLRDQVTEPGGGAL